MGKATRIFRYGHYINTVADNKESLRKWIVANCSYNKAEGTIPSNTPIIECIKIARERGYTFNTTVSDTVSDSSLGRMSKILSAVTIQEVARDITPYGFNGRNIVCSCPSCNSDGMLVIFPKTQAYRCFSCGKSGDIISFVMEVLKMDFETALDFLETKYVK